MLYLWKNNLLKEKNLLKVKIAKKLEIIIIIQENIEVQHIIFVI